MNPYIYEDTSDLLSSSSQYSLIDGISCIVTEERNGRFDLELQYSLNGVNAGKIVPNAIIMSEPRPDADPEPFRICEIEQTIDGVMLVKANHIAYVSLTVKVDIVKFTFVCIIYFPLSTTRFQKGVYKYFVAK